MKKETKNKYSEEYQALLHTPQWQRKKCEVLMRDDFTCQICGATTKFLHVHHWEYIAGHKPWEYEMDNFVTLCEDCHALSHHEGFLKFAKSISEIAESELDETVYLQEREWEKEDTLKWEKEYEEYISGQKVPDYETKCDMDMHERYGYLRKLSDEEKRIVLPYIQKYLIHFHNCRNKEDWASMVEFGYFKNCLSGNELKVLTATWADCTFEMEASNITGCYNWDCRYIMNLLYWLESYCIVNNHLNLGRNIQVAKRIIWEVNKET